MATSPRKRTLPDCPSSHRIKKPCDETVSVFGQLENLSKYHIVWYNESHADPLEYYNISSKFRCGVVDYLECFINAEKCQEHIQSLKKDCPYVILIISVFASSITQLMDDMNLLDYVHSIFIYREVSDDCSNLEGVIANGKRQGKVRSTTKSMMLSDHSCYQEMLF